jgi:hypothetical protein
MRRRRKKRARKNVTRTDAAHMQAQPASQLASRLHVGATDAGGWRCSCVERDVDRAIESATSPGLRACSVWVFRECGVVWSGVVV